MNARNRSIKAAAMGLGIFLTIIIMASILGILGALFNFAGYKEGDNSTEKVDARIANLEIDLKATSLEILRGDKFEVKKQNIQNSLVIETKGNTLKVRESKTKLWNGNNRGILTIFIPQNTTLDSVYIDIGAGRVYIEELEAESIDLDQGAGTVEIKSSEFMNTSIDGGAGKIEIKKSTLHNLDLSSGVGSTQIDGIILGESEIDCGVGSVRLNINNSRDQYKLEVEKGIGSIKIDGEDGYSSGDGVNRLKIDGGVGSVRVDFKD